MYQKTKGFFLARLTQVTCGWAVLKSGQGRASTKPQLSIFFKLSVNSKLETAKVSMLSRLKSMSLVSRNLDYKIKVLVHGCEESRARK